MPMPLNRWWMRSAIAPVCRQVLHWPQRLPVRFVGRARRVGWLLRGQTESLGAVLFWAISWTGGVSVTQFVGKQF